MEITPVTLVGKRARIQPMEERHAEALFEAGRDPSIWTYMPMSIRSPEHMRELVRQALAAKKDGSEFPYVIVDRESGEVVGSTRFLAVSRPNRSLEIGWTWLSPAVWRTSVNTECKFLLLRHAFETLGAIRVQIKTDRRNLRSQQAIERLGATKEGVLRKHVILHDGYVRDSVFYAILDEEWAAVKSGLELKLASVD
ncbi:MULTISPECIES: GNAT family N-acetyltransferase [Saccharibacillus]|uniref:GNAT family N-acetyltransferase n=1 Tax=Saccharibacillus TaxID=456492 RepID=UPI00123A1D81|nr:GNAT family protein [Saccharibacillus sp. WB 17]MWJ30570.1 GNAT family N-acetyltransferase [Saccharibacillus sp. WB 17]